MGLMRVWAIPLAEKGFIPIDPETNPVKWYLEDMDTERILSWTGFKTKQNAENHGRSLGYDVWRTADAR